MGSCKVCERGEVRIRLNRLRRTRPTKLNVGGEWQSIRRKRIHPSQDKNYIHTHT